MSAYTEYLRRNLIVCAAIGARAGTDAAIARLRSQKRPPKWLISMLEGVSLRATGLPTELARWRDIAPDAPDYQGSPAP